jgi:endonuclease YncB( thermonuclease family)
MRLNGLVTVGAAAISGLIFVGCAQQSAAPVTVSEPPTTASPAITAGSAQDSALPLAVSASFHREFPKAGVTRVVPGTTETGQSYYRVTYITNGTPGSVSYYIDGTRLSQPSQPRQALPVRPAAPQTPASSTPGVGRP